MSMLIRLLDQLTNVAWVSIVAAGIVGSIMISFYLTKNLYKDKIQDNLFKSCITMFVIWKFSTLLFEPSMLLDSTINLFGLLLSSGTEVGFYFGLLIGGGYFIRSIKKESIIIGDVSKALFIGALSSFIAYYSIHWQVGKLTTLPIGISILESDYVYHPVSIYQIIANLLFFMFLQLQNKVSPMILFWFSISQILISFSKVPNPYVIGLTLEQLFFILLAGFSLWLGSNSNIEKEVEI